MFVLQWVPRRTRSNQKRPCLNRAQNHECRSPSVIAAITSRTNQHTWFCKSVQGFLERSPLISILSHIIGPGDAVEVLSIQWMVVGRSPCADEAGRDLQIFGHHKLAACSEARRWGSARPYRRPWAGDLGARTVVRRTRQGPWSRTEGGVIVNRRWLAQPVGSAALCLPMQCALRQENSPAEGANEAFPHSHGEPKTLELHDSASSVPRSKGFPRCIQLAERWTSGPAPGDCGRRWACKRSTA